MRRLAPTVLCAMLVLGGACYETHPPGTEQDYVPVRDDAQAAGDGDGDGGGDAQGRSDAGARDAGQLEGGQPDASFVPCADDGVACTLDVLDALGACGHVALDDRCDDGVACTRDACDGALGCTHVPEDARCLDGVQCTRDACDATFGCIRVEDDTLCDDAVGCTHDVCRVGVGCTHATDDALCDDGIDCTHDACQLGGCAFATDDARCDDGIDCTVDACDASTGCQAAPDDARCDDGVACTLDVCDAATGCDALPDDARCELPECGASLCSESLGCTVEPLDADCDDGVACTVDSCRADGSCEHTASDALCAEGETCRTDCGGCILDVAPRGYILAQSYDRLFRVRPDDGHTIEVGTWNTTMTDTALDDQRRLWGLAFGAVFRVDFCTAAIEYFAALPSDTNGMTWSPDGYLYVTAISGTIYRVDTETGEYVSVGMLTGRSSSGDAVVAPDGSLLITATGEGGDHLVRYDLDTMTETVLGNTGYYALYGLAFLGDRLIAGADYGPLFELDPSTGAATPLGTAPYSIWGAAGLPVEQRPSDDDAGVP